MQARICPLQPQAHHDAPYCQPMICEQATKTDRLVNGFYQYCFLFGLCQPHISQAARCALCEHPPRKLCYNPVSSWRKILPLSVYIYGVKQAAQLVCTPKPATGQVSVSTPTELRHRTKQRPRLLCAGVLQQHYRLGRAPLSYRCSMIGRAIRR